MPKSIRLAITMGDPSGIGPEIIVKALSNNLLISRLSLIILGSERTIQNAIKATGKRIKYTSISSIDSWPFLPGMIGLINTNQANIEVKFGKPDKNTGLNSYRAVQKAIHLANEGIVNGIVTAPICKEAWKKAGIKYAGHTELLAYETKSRNHAMLFQSEDLRIALVSIHVPICRVASLIKKEKIIQKTCCVVQELKLRFGIVDPRVAIAGLNPHAGENGMMGKEEIESILPAIHHMKKSLKLNVCGPIPADTLFIPETRKKYDLIMCMYHDQGLIPFKMAAMHKGVNITAGLPIIRTSPDHGTAFDLAGTGLANEGSMCAAIKTAAKMARSKRYG